MKLVILTPSKRQLNPEFKEMFKLIMTGETDEAVINITGICPFVEWPDETDWEMEAIHCMAVMMLLTRTTVGYCINYESGAQYHFGDNSLQDVIFGDIPDEDTLSHMVELHFFS